MSLRPTPADLARLAAKYRALANLRRAKERGEPPPPRATFRALAAEFPGALNELDTLPLDEIDRRADALERAASGAAAEAPWMAWMHGYHALYRAALHAKRHLARAHDSSDEEVRAAAEGAGRHAGIGVDAAFVRSVARPPGGRLATVVLDRLASAFAATPDRIADELFPCRRALRKPSP